MCINDAQNKFQTLKLNVELMSFERHTNISNGKNAEMMVKFNVVLIDMPVYEWQKQKDSFISITKKWSRCHSNQKN